MEINSGDILYFTCDDESGYLKYCFTHNNFLVGFTSNDSNNINLTFIRKGKINLYCQNTPLPLNLNNITLEHDFKRKLYLISTRIDFHEDDNIIEIPYSNFLREYNLDELTNTLFKIPRLTFDNYYLKDYFWAYNNGIDLKSRDLQELQLNDYHINFQAVVFFDIIQERCESMDIIQFLNLDIDFLNSVDNDIEEDNFDFIRILNTLSKFNIESIRILSKHFINQYFHVSDNFVLEFDSLTVEEKNVTANSLKNLLTIGLYDESTCTNSVTDVLDNETDMLITHVYNASDTIIDFN